MTSTADEIVTITFSDGVIWRIRGDLAKVLREKYDRFERQKSERKSLNETDDALKMLREIYEFGRRGR